MNYYKDELNNLFKYDGDYETDNTIVTTLIESGVKIEAITVEDDDYFKNMTSITPEEYTEIQNQKAAQYWNQSLA